MFHCFAPWPHDRLDRSLSVRFTELGWNVGLRIVALAAFMGDQAGQDVLLFRAAGPH
jgi:hypothetical protein